MSKKVNQTIEGNTINNSNVFQINGDFDKELLLLLQNSKGNNLLLNKLISDVIEKVRIDIDEGDLRSAKGTVDSIYTHGTEGIENGILLQLYYYKALILIRDGQFKFADECIACMDSIDTENKLTLTIKIKRRIYDKKYSDFENLFTDIQTEKFSINEKLEFKADYLLNRAEFTKIIAELNDLTDINSDLVLKALGLAFINTNNFLGAREYFEQANKLKKKYEYDYYVVLTQVVPIINRGRGPYDINETERLILVKGLDIFENLKGKLKNRSKAFWREFYSIVLNIYSFIDIEGIKGVLDDLDDDIKADKRVMLVMAEFYRYKKEYYKALDLYERIYDSKTCPEYMIRLFSIFLTTGKYEELINEFLLLSPDQLDKQGLMVCFYLEALYYSEKQKIRDEVIYYEEAFKESPFFYNVSAKVLAKIDKEYSMNLINKAIELIEGDETNLILDITDTCYKLGMYGEVVKLLVSVERKSSYAQRKLLIFLTTNINAENLILAERIVQREIEDGNESVFILNAKADILFEKGLYMSCVDVYEKVFTEEKNERNAFNVLLSKLRINDTENLDKYLAYLIESENPSTLILCANGYDMLGHKNIAKDLAYRSIYLLNDQFKEEVVEQYLMYTFSKLMREEESVAEFEEVDYDRVIFLEDISDGKIKKKCINSEEIYNKEIKTIDVEQHGKDSLIVIELLDRKIDDTILIEGKECRIKKIIDKHTYVFQYLTELYTERFPESRHLKKFYLGENATEIKDTLKEVMFDNSNHNKLLDSYNFLNNTTGIPLDLLAHRSLDNYDEVIKYLLFSNRDILYAGTKNTINLKKAKVILSLSTLTVLRSLNKLYLLDNIKENIIIAESLRKKSLEIYKEVIQANKKVSGTMILNENNEPVYIENDEKFKKEKVNFWRDICFYVNNFKIKKVSQQEVTNSGLEALTSRWIDLCQLESIILASKEKGIFLCDDLFLRKICSFENFGVENTNSISLIDTFDDRECYYQELMDFSKVGYSYVIDEKDSAEILSSIHDKKVFVQNLTNTERKKQLYGRILLKGLYNL